MKGQNARCCICYSAQAHSDAISTCCFLSSSQQDRNSFTFSNWMNVLPFKSVLPYWLIAHQWFFFFFWGSGWVWVWLESTVEPAEAEQLEWLYYWCWSSWSCRRWHKKLTTCWEIRLSAATTWFLTGGTYSLIESSCFPRLLTTQVVLCRKGSDTHTDVSEIFHIFHNMHINLMFEVCFSVWLVET